MATASKAALNSTKLLKSIKMRCMVPVSQISFSDEDLLDFANEEMLIGLVPTILQMKDEYLVFKQQVPMELGKPNYTIPERALGSKLREVSYWDGSNEFEMTQVNPDEKYIGIGLSRQFGFMRQFYVQGSDIIPYPEVKPGELVTGSLNMYFYIRPNNLVKDSAVGVIRSINRLTGEIVLTNMPSTYTSDNAFDFIRIRSPHSILKIDVTPVSVNSTTKTMVFNLADIPEDLTVGDYIPLAGESCIPNVPTELHAILAQRVACRILEAIGDSTALQNAMAKLQEMEGKAGVILDNRVEGSVHKVVNRSVLRNIRGRFSRSIF
jgi:hypothetical protein